MTAPVSIKAVSKSFGAFQALTDINLNIEAGEIIVLLGPSGCGKTTMLSILGGFMQPSAGAVLIGGKDMTAVPPAKRPTTTMFQDYALFPHMSLIDNVGFGLRMRGMERSSRNVKALEFLDLVGLKASADKMPFALSGGQRQRVALARALAVDPDVLLLDEPLGALDLKLRRQMQDELKAIQRRVGTTFVHVTHDQEEAMAIADRIVVMNQGRIEDCGPPSEIYMKPKSIFSAGFMGEANFIEGRIALLGKTEAQIETGLGKFVVFVAAMTGQNYAQGDRVMICIRPEHFRAGEPFDKSKTMLRLGRAKSIETAFFGTHFRVHAMLPGASDKPLIIHLPQTAQVREGMELALSVEATSVVVLPISPLQATSGSVGGLSE
jgi:spermidine/putrescine transport system ATP-binding protein